jgi:hypothetical protein
MSNIPPIGFAAMLLAFVGCASTPMPTEQLAVAEAAVEQAERAGAAEYAAAGLATAQDKLQRARSGADDRSLEAEEVARLAEQAEADAKLAAAQAQAGKMRAAVAETEANLRALEEEAARAAAVHPSTLP